MYATYKSWLCTRHAYDHAYKSIFVGMGVRMFRLAATTNEAGCLQLVTYNIFVYLVLVFTVSPDN